MNDEQLKEQFFGSVSRYKYEGILGRGGMSIVFKAMDLELNEVMAIKVLSPSVSMDDPDLLARFKREINLNRRIKHPNVARLYDFGTAAGLYFITMEFIPGIDLKTMIEQDGPMGLPPLKVISILRQIALGTHAAHQLGIIHRDLKSSNIIVDERGAVAILDFGLARGKFNANITLASTMVGTPNYMSPEQAAGAPVDLRCDLYSIGVIAFEALTGDLPFTGDNPVKVAYKHVTDPVPDTMEYFPGISSGLRAIVYKALAKAPEDRFSTAAEMEAALAAVQSEIPSGEVRLAAAEQKLEHTGAEPENPFPEASSPPEIPEGSIEEPEPLPPDLSIRAPVILLVDPDLQHRNASRDLLTDQGCELIEAADGPEALNTLFSAPADLVFMESRLPGMDGFDVTRIIRSRPELSTIPVVLAVPRLDRGQYAFGIQSGVTDMVPSPYTADHLERAVWRLLSANGFSPPLDVETRLAVPAPPVSGSWDLPDFSGSRSVRVRRI